MNPIRFIWRNRFDILMRVVFFAGFYVYGYRVGYVEGAVDMAVGLANTETNIVHPAQVP